MLEFINGLDPEAWAGLGALVTATVGGIGVAYKGWHRTPAALPPPAPPVAMGGGAGSADLGPVILSELRELNRRHDDGTRIVDARFDEQARLLGRIYTDTQVLRERS